MINYKSNMTLSWIIILALYIFLEDECDSVKWFKFKTCYELSWNVHNVTMVAVTWDVVEIVLQVFKQ